MTRMSKLSIALALALGSPSAYALGLGQIQVRSGLNEPLVAEIPVVEGSAGEAENLRANLANAQDFARVGLDVRGVSVPLAFDVAADAQGRPVIRVTSESPVREPFLSFLVEVSWANGRLLREYNVLLDPPNVAPAIVGTRTVVEPVQEPAPSAVESLEPAPPATAEAAPEVEAPAVAESEPESAPEPAPEPEPSAEAPPAAEAAPEPAPEPVAAAPASAPGEYGPVATGETLWEIANATRPEGVSVNQMMLAILRANPDAFFRDNVNALKRGAVLRIPAADEATATAATEAAAQIAAQSESWRGAAAPTLVAEQAPVPSSSAPAASDTAAADPRLALVPPREDSGSTAASTRAGVAGGTDQSAALRSELARAQEQLASREQESRELRSRVQELEGLRSQNERLVTLKDTEIADLTRRLREAEAAVAREREAAAAAAAAAAPSPVASPSPSPVESPAVAGADPLPSPTDSPLAGESPAPTPSDAGATADPLADPLADPAATADPLATASPGTEGDPAATPSPLDALAGTDPSATDASATPTETPADDAGASVSPLPEEAAVTPVESTTDATAQPWWRNRNLLLGGSLGLILLGGLLFLLGRRKRGGTATPPPRASVADQFSKGVFAGGAAGAAAAGAHADADAEEERAHLEQLAADPTDLDSHLALLRLYHERSDEEKFEAAAGAMYAQVADENDPRWTEARRLGRSLQPENDLYADRAATAESAPRADYDFDAFGTQETAAPAAAAPAPAPGRSGDTGLFDFDLARNTGETAAPPPAAAPAKPAESFDFDLRANADQTRFDTEIEKPVIERIPTATVAPAAAADDLPPAAGDGFLGEDAVGTKLDLARAYLDMGDPEGARSMLQEVLAEGNEQQRGEARRLLADIG